MLHDRDVSYAPLDAADYGDYAGHGGRRHYSYLAGGAFAQAAREEQGQRGRNLHPFLGSLQRVYQATRDRAAVHGELRPLRDQFQHVVGRLPQLLEGRSGAVRVRLRAALLHPPHFPLLLLHPKCLQEVRFHRLRDRASHSGHFVHAWPGTVSRWVGQPTYPDGMQQPSGALLHWRLLYGLDLLPCYRRNHCNIHLFVTLYPSRGVYVEY